MGIPAKQNELNESNMKATTSLLEELKKKFNQNPLDTNALKTK